MPGGYPEEELLRSIGLVAIVHALVYAQQHSNTRNEEQGRNNTKVGQTLESIGSFTTWRIGRRLANILDANFPAINTMQLLSIILISLSINQYSPKFVGPSFPKVAHDLMIMIAVFRLASSAMFIFQQGDAHDALILLLSGMVAVRLFIHIFV